MDENIMQMERVYQYNEHLFIAENRNGRAEIGRAHV